MFNLLFVFMMVPLIGCMFAIMAKRNDSNAYFVSLFTTFSAIIASLLLFSRINYIGDGMQLKYSFLWLESMNIILTFGMDIFSLLMLLGIYISFAIGLVGLPEADRKNKTLQVMILLLLWLFTGFFAADDLVSFYIFFAGMLIPLYMAIGLDGNIRKKSTLYLFFLYNFAGILLLLFAIMIAFRFYHGNMLLREFSLIKMPMKVGLFVWGGVCLSFISRIPIWPFHYWISSISSGIKNPLVYIVTNLMPLTGLYGFIRFWQSAIADSMRAYVPIMVAFCLLTMLFIVLTGIARKQFLYKLFSYMTVYYLMFLLAVVLLSSIFLTDTLLMNIGYALFIFLIVNSSLVVLDLRLERESAIHKIEYKGVLAYMPKLAAVFAYFVLIAIGLPISSMFWNNFIIISALFNFSFFIGLVVMVAILMISIALLYELYLMRDLQTYATNNIEFSDLTRSEQAFFISIILILFLSFFNPLWFVF